MNKKHGHYCKICGEHKANEKFSGRGHANHICKVCMALPILGRNELQIMRKIESIDMSFKMTREQQGLLRKYAKDDRYPESSEYAKGVLGRIEENTEEKQMKHEYKKDEKHIYLPKTTPQQIDIPAYKFFTIEGKGNPNGEDFAARIGALYPAAYTLKMMPKSGFTPDGYFEYTVYPLEGIWDLTEKGRASATLDKGELVYKIMIRQPDFVTDEVAQMVLDKAKSKKGANPLLDEVKFENITDGACVQMLHIGSFDDEVYSFEKMKAFCELNNLVREDLRHREIYLSDFRKTVPEKLKTVLRYFVKGVNNMPKTKLRKMLGAADSPYIVSLMNLIETQSKTTICKWCIDYSEEIILPIFIKSCPDDTRLQSALNAAREWLLGKIKFPEAKKYILDAHAVARELENDPVCQAAARAVGQAAASIHMPTHSLGVAFYGAAAVAYDRIGLLESAETYEKIAAEECAKYETALRSVAVKNEPNRAKLNWNC